MAIYSVDGDNADNRIDIVFDADPEGDRIDNKDAPDGSNDDLVQAFGGDDTIFAELGEDTVYAGSGNDYVDGGQGDDLIFGDRSLPGGESVEREVFRWSLAPDPNDPDPIEIGDPISGFVQNTGSVDVTFSVHEGIAPLDAEFATNAQNVSGIDTGGAPADAHSSLSAEVSGYCAHTELTFDFSQPVENLSFRINDLDGHERVRIYARNAEGALVPVNLTGGMAVATYGATAKGYASSPDFDDDDAKNSLLVDIAGPLSSIVIRYEAGGGPSDGINLTDVYFDTTQTIMDDGLPGNDTLLGGNGNDTIFGDEGDDLLVGGNGDDVLFGGDGNDTLLGGNGDDTLFGEAGDDSLLGENGDDELFGGAGDDTLGGGLGDDTLLGGAGDDSLMGDQGDDILFGEDGDDTLDGGRGDDTIFGGRGDDLITGGENGANFLFGGDDRDTFFNVTPDDRIFGGDGGVDYDTLDMRGAGPFRLVDVVPDSDGFGVDGTIEFLSADRSKVIGTARFENIENIIPCFTPGTRIATPRGERLVEELKVGDRVITRDNGLQEIRWIGTRPLSADELRRAAHLRPILIRAGALGHGLPERDMLVSPQHRLLLSSERAELYFNEREVLVAATHLTTLAGVEQVVCAGTTYIHFMCDHHEVILSNGAWTESFQPGAQVLDGMGEAQRDEIFELFPELRTPSGLNAYQAARRSLRRYEAQVLMR